MHETKWMEQVSKAYVRAVATAVEAKSQDGPEPDDNCVDVVLTHFDRQAVPATVTIHVQAKSTKDTKRTRPGHVAYQIDRRSFDIMADAYAPVWHILVLFEMPHDPIQWSPHFVGIQRNAYYMVMTGQEWRGGKSDYTLQIPLSQTFSPKHLLSLFEEVREKARARSPA